MKTIAIDFDGVIHRYSNGWQDGTIYDEPIPGAFKQIKKWMEDGYAVFVFSSRSPRQIKRWLKKNEWQYGTFPDVYSLASYGFEVETIPFYKKFWNKPNVLGITNRKLPAIAYIDDRAIEFTGEFEDIVLPTDNRATPELVIKVWSDDVKEYAYKRGAKRLPAEAILAISELLNRRE